MKVLKFGGTSVGSANRIREVARLVSHVEGRRIVVLSAMSGTTDTLVALCEEISNGKWQQAQDRLETLKDKYWAVVDELFDEAGIRELAKTAISPAFAELKSQTTNENFTRNDEKVILSKGEIVTVQLLLLVLRYYEGNAAEHLRSLSFMKIDHDNQPDTEYIQRHLRPLVDSFPDSQQLFVAEGYICTNAFGEVDNLRRGGSDYTATLIGEAVEAEEIQIWTDIDGLHDNDPRVVNVTRPVRRLHFGEAAELAHFGAKILHPACIEPARRGGIPVKLLNTLEPEARGTTISSETGKATVKAISAKDGISVLTLSPLLSLNNTTPALENTILTATQLLEEYHFRADLVSSNGSSYMIALEESDELSDFIASLKKRLRVEVQHGISILAVVGDMGWENIGFEARILEALEDLPLRLVSYGSSRYSLVLAVATEDKEKALNALSRHLFKHLKLSLELE